MTSSPRGALALIGPGRAGTAITVALTRAGWKLAAVAGRDPSAPAARAAADRFGARVAPLNDVSAGADLVVIAVPDAALDQVARTLAASPSLRNGALVVHLAGSRGLDVFAPLAERRPDVRTATLHPLQTLPAADEGAARLPGAWCAVAGDEAVTELAVAIGCHPLRVDDADRARYHAAACIAGNHLVALLAQVERLAASVGVPFAAFTPLLHAAIDNTELLGAAAALTGPVARDDVETVAGHLRALPVREQPAYRALAREALRLTGRPAGAMGRLLAGSGSASPCEAVKA